MSWTEIIENLDISGKIRAKVPRVAVAAAAEDMKKIILPITAARIIRIIKTIIQHHRLAAKTVPG